MGKSKEENTAEQWVNVKDIEDSYIITKDGYLISLAYIGKINIDLLSKAEKSERSRNIASEFKSLRKPFDIISIPRTVNMEKHIADLQRRYNSETDMKKRMILSILMKQDNEIMMTGSNYEHQFYFRCEESIENGIDKAKLNLRQRQNDYKKIFSNQNIRFEVLSKAELIKVCNLFGNGEIALMYRYENIQEDLPYSMIQ